MRPVRTIGRWLLAALMLVLRPLLRRGSDGPDAPGGEPPAPPPERVRAGQGAVFALLGLGSAGAACFIAAYVLDGSNEVLGLSIGVAIGSLGAASIVASKLLIPEEVHEQQLPDTEHVEEREQVAEIVAEAGARISRRRLMIAAAGGSVAVTGAALLLPAASLGPLLETDRLRETPWRAGTRLVDDKGAPILAADLDVGGFATAFAEGAPGERLDASVVVVRLALDELRLPPDRADWAPQGILAYSRSCTHAACAVSLFDYPAYRPTSPRARLVCPCHYSAFDAGGGGEVLAGPAGRPLPQLPLAIDGEGVLLARGDFSGPPGPSWYGVRR